MSAFRQGSGDVFGPAGAVDGDVAVFNGATGKIIKGSTKIDAMPVGSVLQTKYAKYTSAAALSPTIPADDTPPLNTEGTEILSVAITPFFTNSLILANFVSSICQVLNNNAWAISAVFRSGVAEAIGATGFTQGIVVARDGSQMSILVDDFPATLSSVIYSVRVGASAGSITMNGAASTRFFGGAAKTILVVQEIKQ